LVVKIGVEIFGQPRSDDMKNKLIILAGLALGIGLTGCSHEDSKRLSNDMKATGEAVKQTATDAAEAAKKTANDAVNSPRTKQAGDDLENSSKKAVNTVADKSKELADQAAAETKKAAQATADFVQDASSKAADATKKAAEKAKSKVQDPPKP
jgi:hypothetical protein